MDIAAALRRQESNRCDPPLREESIVVAASDLAVASVVAAAEIAVELAAAAAAAAEPAAAFVAAAAVAVAGTLLDSIVYHRPAESKIEAREAPRDMVRARARLTRAGDRFRRPRLEVHRPAVGFPTRRNPVVVAAVVAAVGTVHRPGEIPAPGPTDPGVSPCYLCTIRRARQYL